MASLLGISEEELHDLIQGMVRMGYLAEVKTPSVACGDARRCKGCPGTISCDPDRLPTVYELTEKGNRIASGPDRT